MKRSSITAVVAAMSIWLITGCLNGGVQVNNGDGPAESAAKPVTIVINSLGMTFPPGMDENDNPYLHYIETHTGLDIGVVLPPQQVYEEKLDVLMSSGSVPDLIHTFDPVWLDGYAKRKALLPLESLIDRFGPALKELIPEEAWEQVSYNGHIYAVPSLNEVPGTEIVYARKDWLDRLGMKPPVTLDEYYEVIRAFTLDDPDGNGADDTLGLIMTENLGRSGPFFGAFGTQLDRWLERDGRLVYGSVLPETKEALVFFARLYGEGLLDPEFPLNRLKNLHDKIENGVVGLYSATWYDTRGPIAASKAKDPSAEWIALPYPTGKDGRNGTYAQEMIRGYNVVPAGAANPEGVIRMLNFIAGEGHRTLKLGFENEIWSLQDGRIVTNFAEHDKHLYRGMYQALVDVKDPVLFKQRLDSLGDFDLYDNLRRIEDHAIPNAFTGAPTEAMSKYRAKLNELKMEELFTKIVMGIEPLDAFDRFAEQWREAGGDEMTREVNEWYARKNKESEGAIP
ncbi:extracellular solute-binding protein [Paenibacillus cisolokensis]|uniref:extracellular solute-binding protein n=1 Tax=Paenibacillus cisolokensis TaxID=1658519 RepID=UPI003D2D66E3